MDNDFQKQLGQRIKELRLSRNLKQCEVADMLNMERSHYTRIESGKHIPSNEKLIKLSKILNVKIKDLFDFEHQKAIKKLITEIQNSLNGLSEKEIQYGYKTIENVKQLHRTKGKIKNITLFFI